MFPRTLDGIAVAQLGLISTAQSNDHGLDADSLKWLRHTGVLHKYRRGVDRLAGVPPLPEHPAL
ncbi:MAG: hypothetical protein ACLGHT_11155, partial [Acidimicrobiia bacterium]